MNDLIRVGGAVARLTRDGFGKNLTTGLDNYNKDLLGGRAARSRWAATARRC